MRPAAERDPLSPRARILLPLLLLALLVVTWHRYQDEPQRPYFHIGGSAMGTTWSVKVAHAGLDGARERAAVDAASSSIERVEALMSTWRADSELVRLNAQPGGVAFPLAAETFRVFEIAQGVSALSGGAFDVTVSPLVAAWGFGAGARALEPTPPSPAELRALRARVGYTKLALDRVAGTLTKQADGVECDLSAVAKGFAVDEVARALLALGLDNFLVEIGGELRGAGVRLDGEAWRVAIEEPDAVGRRVHRVVALRDAAMATSGDYRNYYESEGRRVSHTIDPRSGEPIRHRLASVTVIHSEAAEADALATALNVLGPEAGYTLATRQGLAAYFLIRNADGSFRPEMTQRFSPWLATDAAE
ncbi:MAG: FAD:protein FMN transferase [Deltaproteobacteria bacterium]|nr:FAD:protein FMN transferase [Deltaproteobacteria bacterium]MBW2359329.1 FAD:protein FMN transferase [Deltaproteobacteria bacterium]